MVEGSRDTQLTEAQQTEGREALPFFRWSGGLHEATASLNILTKETEEQFLTIGSRLNDFYSRSGDISNLSSALLDCMLGDELTGTTRGLEDTLEKMHLYLGQSSELFGGSLKTLQDVQGAIRAARTPLDRFGKIIKKLRILGISTKIESAQLNGDKGGFITLADDVEKLSVLIHDKCGSIGANAGTLNGIIQETLARLSSLEEKQRSQVGGILAGIKGSLSTLTEKHERSSKAAGEIAEQLAAISGNIGKVVMSMQFHDITRQQIEHVATALNDLAHRLATLDVEAKTHESGNENTREDVIEAGDLCELQASQLKDALEKFLSAVDNIISSLSGIVESVTDMSARTKEVAGTADLVSSSFFTSVETGIAQVISSLRENGRASEDLSSAIDSLLRTVKEMSGFVDDIEEIGDEIELIAVNARVKAAHTGDEGAPLGVIAEAIQKLSIEASTQKTAISDMLKSVISSTKGLHEGISADIHERLREIDDMAEGLNGLLVSLRDVHGKIFSFLERIDKTGRSLAEDIREGISGITVQWQFDNTITGVLSVLDAVVREAREIAPVENVRQRKDALERLKRHYTMQSELDIHESYEGTKVIDLTKARASRTDDSSVEGISGTDIAIDLGDNVELF